MTDFRNDQGTGSVIADTSTIPAMSGTTALSMVPQLIAAAGATQAAAPLITNALVFITVCTASARGVRLPTASTGKMVYIFSACTQGTKVYPFAGDKIQTAATNAAVVQTGLKGVVYAAKDTLVWYANRGA